MEDSATKIKGGLEGSQIRQGGELTPQALTRRRSLKDRASGSTEATEEKLNIDLARAIHAELNPEAMAAERRQRIEQLTKQVREGRYNPSSEAVAGKVEEEITFEIMTSRGALLEDT